MPANESPRAARYEAKHCPQGRLFRSRTDLAFALLKLRHVDGEFLNRLRQIGQTGKEQMPRGVVGLELHQRILEIFFRGSSVIHIAESHARTTPAVCGVDQEAALLPRGAVTDDSMLQLRHRLRGRSRKDMPVLVVGGRDRIRLRRGRQCVRGIRVGEPVKLSRNGGALRVEFFEAGAQFLNPRLGGGISRFHSRRRIVGAPRPGFAAIKVVP
jgi:hypothetical protein